MLHGPMRLHVMTPRIMQFASSYLHVMTPQIASLTISHLAEEKSGENIMSEILTNFFSEEFVELRSSSTPSAQEPPPRKQCWMVQ
jgi:hypothetical protein